MRRRRRALEGARSLVAGLALAAAQVQGSTQASPDETNVPAVMTVTVDKQRWGDWFVRRTADGRWLVRRQDLQALAPALALPARSHDIDGEPHLDPLHIDGLTLKVDESRMAIDLRLPATVGGPTVLGRPTRPSPDLSLAGSSSFLNWALQRNTHDPGVQLTTEAGWRAGALLVTTAGLSTFDKPAGPGWSRLWTAAHYDRPKQLERWTLGDLLTRSDSLGTGLQIGGLSVSRSFSLEPYAVRHPLDSVRGQAQLPSQVEVYVDGQRVRTGEVPAGDFVLQDLATPPGARTVQVLLRDPFGREQRFDTRVYTSEQLLRSGLHEYQYAVGRIRRHYGGRQSDYGPAVITGLHRWGWSDALTLGLRLEAMPGLASGGPSAVARLGQAGVLSLAASSSHAEGVWGRALAWRHDYQSSGAWISLGQRLDSPGYAAVTETAALSTRHSDSSVAMGYHVGSLGQLSLSRSVLTTHPAAQVSPPVGWRLFETAPRQSSALTWSRALRSLRGTLRATYARGHDASGLQQQLVIGLTLVTDGRTVLSATSRSGSDGSSHDAYLARPVPRSEGWGGELGGHWTSGSDRSPGHWRAASQWHLPSLRLRAEGGQDDERAQPWGRLSASGGVSWTGGQSYLSRPIESAWALVKVGELPGVAVTVNGAPAGETDARGQLLLPEVSAYQEVTIGIEAAHLPIDATVPTLQRRLRLPERAGAVVDFEVRTVDLDAVSP